MNDVCQVLAATAMAETLFIEDANLKTCDAAETPWLSKASAGTVTQ
jgi:hypothetical protein